MTALRAGIAGVSVWGPGLTGWAASRAILAGEQPYQPQDAPPPAPAWLPPNERRRIGPVVRLALTVAQQAVEASGLAANTLRGVFASANGDGPVLGAILDALTAAADGAGRVVSPTQFHTSVHNAAAGYWSIATGNPLPAVCLGCHDSTWAAGLLAAMVEVRHGNPVLLCVYDHPMPARYAAKRPVLAPFGVGLVLTPSEAAAPPLATLSVAYAAAASATAVAPDRPELRALAAGNPAGRALRLLESLALGCSGRCDAAYLEGALEVTLTVAAAP